MRINRNSQAKKYLSVLLLLAASSFASIIFISTPSIPPVHAVSPPALDGTPGTCASNACSASTTTSGSTDVLIVIEHDSASDCLTPTGSITWTLRAAEAGGDGDCVNEYYSTNSGSGFGSGSHSATCNWTSPSQQFCAIFGVSGASLSTPFDASGTLPGECNAGGVSSNPSCTISTANADDLLIGGVSEGNGHTWTPGSGFTALTIGNSGSGECGTSFGNRRCDETQQVTSTQSSLAVTITMNTQDAFWDMIADAVEAPLTLVTEPVQVTFLSTYGGSTQTVTISGCSASPSTFSGDGTVHNISMAATCGYTLSLPSGYAFSNGKFTAGTSTCSSGTCSTFSTGYFKTFYTIGTYHGIANSIKVVEPDYVLQIANGSNFHIGGFYDPFALNYSRATTVDVCSNSIGEGCWWTERIACGCGSDQSNPATAVRVWHVLEADPQFLVVQYNNSFSSSSIQPRDNYTMIFYRGTNQFTWNVDEKMTSVYTGDNGYDEASSYVVSSPTTVCLQDDGTLLGGPSSACNTTFSKTAEAQLKEIQFVGSYNNKASGNYSIYEYPISTNNPYEWCGAGNNGEEKCTEVPSAATSVTTSGPITFYPGWKNSVTFVIYPVYNDAGGLNTNAVNLAKQLYLSSYGGNVNYLNWKSPLYCDPTVLGGNQAQGCAPTNTNLSGMFTQGNSYAWYHAGGQGVGAFTFFNQTTLQQGSGSPAEYDSARISMDTFPQNNLVNGSGTFFPASHSNTVTNSSSKLIVATAVNLHDVTGTIYSIAMPKTNNYYKIEANSTVIHSTQITTLSYSIQLPGPISGCDVSQNEASSFFRTINATTMDYEYKDSIYHNWLGYTIGVKGVSSGAGVTFATYTSSCHDRPVVELNMISNGSPTSYSPGQTFGEVVYLLPHFGNLTSVAAVLAYETKSVTMSPEKQMYQKPINLGNTTEPLALEIRASPTSLFFANSTGSGYDAVVRAAAGTQTRYFLWNATIGGSLSNVIGSTSWSKTALSGGFYNVTVTFTSTGHNLLDFLSGATATVNLTCDMSNSAAADTVLLSESSGSSLSPTSALCNGSPHSITVDVSVTLTVDSGTCSSNCEHMFNFAGPLLTTFSFTTPSSGSASRTFHDYLLLTNTYVAAANAQTNFDTSMSCTLTGTIGGNASSSNHISSTAATSDSSSVYFDYNTQVSFCSTFSSPPANSQWIKTGTFQFTDTTGGNTHTVQYWKQWTNNFKYSVSHGSPTAPTLSCNQIGSTQTLGLTTSNQAFFCDNSTSATATNPTTGSTSSERWSDNGQTFTITSGGGTDTFAYYDQLNNTYRATPVNPVAWDGSYSITVKGTQFGSAAQTGCTLSTVSGNGAIVCAVWFDYNTQVTVLSPIVVSSTEHWVQSCGTGGNQFTQTTGGHLDNCNYGRQWQVQFAISPSSTGSINPSATAFYNDGANGTTLTITGTPNAGHVFSSWTSSTGSITFTSSSSSPTTAHIGAAGTITANFVIATPSTVSLTVTISEGGAPSSSYTINGCSASPSTGTTGILDSVSMTSSCSFTVYFAGASGGSRYGFIVSSTFSNTSSIQTSCSSGTCTVSLTAHLQKQLTITGGYSTATIPASETNDGWYNYGDSVKVTSNGINGRSGGSGTRISYWTLDGGAHNLVATISTVTTSSVAMTAIHTILFNAINQFQVTFNAAANSALVSCTSPSIGGDNYWYDTGTSSVTCILNGVYGRTAGTGTRVTGYRWDSGSTTTESTAATFLTSPQIMSSTHQVNCNTVAQYQLTASANPSYSGTVVISPTGTVDSSWFDSGSTATVHATTSGPKINFTGWTGTGTGSYTGSSNPTPSITMNNPINEVASFVGGAGQFCLDFNNLSSSAIILPIVVTVAIAGLLVYVLVTMGSNPDENNDMLPIVLGLLAVVIVVGVAVVIIINGLGAESSTIPCFIHSLFT